MSKESFVKGAKNLIERIALRIVHGFLVRYSAVIAKHFSQRDAEFAAFKAEVIQVATDHHSRLRKLEVQ